jgi:hypothetical protein
MIISNARTVHEVLWEAWNIITSLILFGIKVVLVPVIAVIILADFIIAATIVGICGFALAFLMGWISIGDVLVFLEVHGTAFATELSARLNDWASAHPNSALAQMFGDGTPPHQLPGGPPAQ